MFDFAWSEIALIAIVALIAIGPKDLPIAIKALTRMMKKARRMAAEFQTHVDDLVKEADLHEVRDQINTLRGFNIRREIEKAVDSDGSLRSTFSSNLMDTTPAKTAETPVETIVAAHETPVIASPAEIVDQEAPAFIPPEQTEPAESAAPPAFIPPGTHRA
jgi:sec-independent protein translocase protein TatB